MNKADVYFLEIDRWREIPSVMDESGLSKIIAKNDFVAIKMHLGEKGNKGYIKPELIKPIIKKIKELGAHPFVTDANTIYRGQRIDAVHHLMVAAEHGFHPKFLEAPVVIADGLRGSSYAEVEVGLKHFKKVKIAEAIYNADVILSIAHFKGHELCGIGGAIKNLGMGCAARAGKYEQHNSVVPSVDIAKCTVCGTCIKWCGGGALSLASSGVIARPKAEAIPQIKLCSGDCRAPSGLAMTIHFTPSKCTGCGQCILACPSRVFNIPWDSASSVVQEKIAEHAMGAVKNKRALYINFLSFITPQCDCFKTVTKPLLPDIGILLSGDPVAIDQASLDLVTKHAGHDILKEATGTDGTVQIKYAESLGIGTRGYNLKPKGDA